MRQFVKWALLHTRGGGRGRETSFTKVVWAVELRGILGMSVEHEIRRAGVLFRRKWWKTAIRFERSRCNFSDKPVRGEQAANTLPSNLAPRDKRASSDQISGREQKIKHRVNQQSSKQNCSRSNYISVNRSTSIEHTKQDARVRSKKSLSLPASEILERFVSV